METRVSSRSPSQQWGFFNPTRIHFGIGARSEVLQMASRNRTLIVSSRRGRAQIEKDPILCAIAGQNVSWVGDVESNPSLSTLSLLQEDPEFAKAESIIAFGGGSSMDSAKAISAMLAARHEGVSLREIVRQPSILDNLACPPIHCIPTTSGTGAEVTPFATIWDHEARRKLSLVHSALYPMTAVVDPELMVDVPQDVTLATALDALNQAFESVWNRNASPYTLRIAGLAIEKGLRALSILSVQPRDLNARSEMAEASLFAGLCISQTRTAICHSISYPLTAHFRIPHGIACAFPMKAVAQEVLTERPEVLETLAPLAGYRNAASLIQDLFRILSMPPVQKQWQDAKSSSEALLSLRGEMFTQGRSDNFIIPVDDALVFRILTASLRQ